MHRMPRASFQLQEDSSSKYEVKVDVVNLILHIHTQTHTHTYMHAYIHTSPLQGAHLMVCNRSWHLPGNPKLVWHPVRLIKEGGCVDLSMDTQHLKYSLVVLVYEGSALTLPLVLLSPRIIMVCHCSSTMTRDHFLLISYSTK